MLTPGRWYHCSTRHMGGYVEIIRHVGRLGQVAKASTLTLAGCVVEELQHVRNNFFFSARTESTPMPAHYRWWIRLM
jgi:hypothetical protein